MKSLLVIALVFGFHLSIGHAQGPEFPAPEAEHVWLQQFVGEWTSTSQSKPVGDHPAMECSGKMKSKMLGGFWVVNNMDATIGEFKFQAIQTIGYDTKTKKYVGTWIDSMMNYMWHYEGSVSDSGKKLELIAEGPSMTGGTGMATYRDSYEFKSADLIIATSEVKNESGEWETFMTGKLVRVKP